MKPPARSRPASSRWCSHSQQPRFQAQALADLVELTLSKGELEGFYEEFLIKKNHLSNPQFAFSLMNRYIKVGDFEKSQRMAKELLEYFPLKVSLNGKKRKTADSER